MGSELASSALLSDSPTSQALISSLDCHSGDESRGSPHPRSSCPRHHCAARSGFGHHWLPGSARGLNAPNAVTQTSRPLPQRLPVLVWVGLSDRPPTGPITHPTAAHAVPLDAHEEGGCRARDQLDATIRMEIVVVTQDVHSAHASAFAHVAAELSAPTEKPWGQVVSYLRAPDGTLVELCTPVQACAVLPNPLFNPIRHRRRRKPVITRGLIQMLDRPNTILRPRANRHHCAG